MPDKPVVKPDLYLLFYGEDILGDADDFLVGIFSSRRKAEAFSVSAVTPSWQWATIKHVEGNSLIEVAVWDAEHREWREANDKDTSYLVTDLEG